MHYEPGTRVEKDQLLFTIDPEPFGVALVAAKAELISHRAELSLAQTEYERTETIYRQKATSEIALIKARAKRDKAAAAVAASQVTVLGGQLAATVIAVVLVPVFFAVFQRMAERPDAPRHTPTAG